MYIYMYIYIGIYGTLYCRGVSILGGWDATRSRAMDGHDTLPKLPGAGRHHPSGVGHDLAVPGASENLEPWFSLVNFLGFNGV